MIDSASWQVLNADCLTAMQGMEAESFHAVVTDPPYHLVSQDKRDHRRASPAESQRTKIGGFMGQEWDGGDVAFRVETWVEVLRVAKPGAHLLAFGSSRTFHRLASAIEDAGWEVRDTMCWIFGQGFPKNLNVSEAIRRGVSESDICACDRRSTRTIPGSQDCLECGGIIVQDGLGTALKPAMELICLARKPLQGTVAQNVQKHGCGALDIDGSRVQGAKGDGVWGTSNKHRNPAETVRFNASPGREDFRSEQHAAGRWPANVLLDEEAARLLDGQAEPTNGDPRGHGGIWSESSGEPCGPLYRDGGSPSRFFYTSKAGQDERPEVNGVQHPTVKPLDLMRYLVGLVSREGDLVLDPFAGSGTTGEACVGLGRRVVLIEANPKYVPLIEKRMQTVTPSLFSEQAQEGR